MLKGMAVEKQPSFLQATVVTKHASECFQGTDFNNELRQVQFSVGAKRGRHQRMKRLGFAGDARARSSPKNLVAAHPAPKVGG
jgi:hypothetical protein